MQTAGETLSSTDLKKLFRTARWALALTWRINKGLLLMIVFLTLLHSMVPAALAIIVRGLVNAVASASGATNANVNEILLWLGLGFGITLVDTVGNFALRYFHQRLHDELNLHVTGDILQHAATLDVAYFEDPDFQDILERTQQGVARRFSLFVSKMLNVAANVLQMITLTSILAVIEPLVVAVLLIVALPYFVFQWRLAKARYAMEFDRITKQRWSRYFVMRLTVPDWVPEVKLLKLAPLLISKFRSLMAEFRDFNQVVYRRVFWGSSLYASLSGLAFYLTFARVALRALSSSLTIGDVAIYGGAMARLRHSLENAIGSMTEALEHTLSIANLRSFFEIEPLSQEPDPLSSLPLAGRGEIIMRDVMFTYPGTNEPAIDGVSLHISPGETVAIVGRNGAGKTTLVKLVARLYEPDCGCIMFDRVDTRAISLNDLHRQLSFVFQRFGRYEATAAENVAYGNWEALVDDRGAIEEVARIADAHHMITKLPDGYDTHLGRMFGQHMLSDGQWQKIAIARAFARDASLLILDEPTSNLDPRAEYRIFANFRQLARGRTTILISHRFSTVSMADRILVMEKGQIIERGTHEELVDQAGHYAALYNLHRRHSARWEK